MAFWERKPVDGRQQTPPVLRDQPHNAGVLAGRGPYLGPATNSWLAAVQQSDHLSTGPASGTIDRDQPPNVTESDVEQQASVAEAEPKDSTSGQEAGRHLSSRSRADGLLRRHGARFASFSVIGGGIFVAGLLLQAGLTSGLHVPSLISYIVQAVVSVEVSYLLNRWFTWRGAKTPFWGSFLRYNLQKAVTVTANLFLYGVLLKLGVEYLLANVLLTIVFTFVNYIGADKLVFLRGGQHLVAPVTGPLPILTGHLPPSRMSRQPAPRSRRPPWELPSISVVIPVRANEKTIRAAIDSILSQDYPALHEVILVGSPGDSTWTVLQDVDDPRLFIMETETPPGIRDANFKRDFGITRTSGTLVSLIDSDMVLPPDWMSTAVRLLMENEVDCVAGVMRSVNDNFWGRFVDRNRLGAKTPRANGNYLVTAEEFGAGGSKPPITADILFTRKMYDDCPIDSSWTHGSLEDYEWFWRVVRRGHLVYVSDKLFGWHHHRAGLKNLSREYRRSARGCAFFIRAHRDSPFAQKRMTQAIVLPLAAFGLALGVAAATYMHHGKLAVAGLAVMALTGMALLSVREFARSRTLESFVYPIPALALGLNYTASLAMNLVRNTSMRAATPTAYDIPALAVNVPTWRKGLAWLRNPLTFVLAFQAVMALSLIWSNTAFSDEADYLWVGETLIGHALHGTAWPTQYAHSTLSGLPFIYPPLGALANMIGGLVAARILSLFFMLCATVFIYATAKKLYGRASALCSAALWATFSPVIQLGAFATFDALSVSLTALAAWLIVRTGYSTKRGEMVLASALALAAAELTAYSGLVMIPIVVLFAFLVWIPAMGAKSAIYSASWLAGVTALIFAAVMTVARTWPGIMSTVISRNIVGDASAGAGHIFNDSWTYCGIIAILAAMGAIYAILSKNRMFWLSTVYQAAIVLVIPLGQIHDSTAVSLKKHLAYGGIFVVMAAGYGLTRLGKALPAERWASIVCGAVAFALPVVIGIQSATNWYHTWPDDSSLMVTLKPIISERSEITVSLGNARYLCLYAYADLGNLWKTSCSSDLTISSAKAGTSQYIVLGYPTSVDPTSSIPSNLLLSRQASQERFLSFLGSAQVQNNAKNPELAQLTQILEASGLYQLVAVGPYNSYQNAAIYTVWKRVTPSAAKGSATATIKSKAVKP